MRKLFLLSLLMIKSILNKSCKEIISEAKSEETIKELIEKNIKNLTRNSNECIELLLSLSLFDALRFYLTELNKSETRFRETLNNIINTRQKNLENINNKYKYDDNEYQVVSPAFQWAQSTEMVYIEVKFAHRHDSPGCLEVEKLNRTINDNKIFLSGLCVLGDFPIKFEFDIECFDALDPESPKSSFGFGSVGRYQMFIKKKEDKYWDRLLKNNTLFIPNMKIWYEMKNKYDLDKPIEDEDDKSFEEIAKEIKEKRKKRKKKKNKKNKKVKSDL